MKKILTCLLVLFCLNAGVLAAKLEIGKNGELVLDGKPRILLVVWMEPVPYMDYFIDLGIEGFWTSRNPGGAGSDGLSMVDYVNEAGKRNAFVIVGIKEALIEKEFDELAKLPALVGWTLPDEVDCAEVDRHDKLVVGGKNPKYSPAEIKEYYDNAKKRDPLKRLIMLNFGGGFAAGDLPQKISMYKEWAKYTDILSVTNYPFNSFGPDKGYLIAKGIKQLEKIQNKDKNTPKCTSIYIGNNDFTAAHAPRRNALPHELRAEVWMVIVNGGTMISYYPHKHIPAYMQRNIKPDIEAEVKRLNKNIKDLNDVIFAADFSEKVKIEEKEGSLYGMMAREKDGNKYIFIVNEKNKDMGKVKIKVEGLAAGAEIEVYDEGRKLVSRAGNYEDNFKEFDTHIYVIKKK